ncbi:citrate transporter [Candidatus Epulonipiscium viviparus]|uniref:citrate transporter n=1 Tax=Candidatus Epulonipiscium viviparus TaxID=420336 RepID=UPI0018DB5FCD|nr:citrate transporter [Candidatus Epulopiscium viviparus]
MKIIAIFIGIIYLWTFVDSIWPSLLSVFLLGSIEYMSMSELMMNFLGSPTVVQTIFTLIFIGALIETNMTAYLGRWFLTIKCINGRPWMFTFAILLGCYFLSFLSSSFAAIFLYWSILYEVFEELGYTKEDKYVSTSLIAIVITSILGFSTAPFKNIPLVLITNFNSLTGVAINNVSYLGMSLTLSILNIIGLLAVMKYIIKVDVTRLKTINIDMFKEKTLITIDIKGKIIISAFVLYIVAMLLPSILPTDIWLYEFLNKTQVGIVIGFVAALCAFRIKGKAIIDFQKIGATHMYWNSIFIISASLLLGNALTNEITGVTEFLTMILQPILATESSILFICLLLTLAILLTNICSGTIIGLILLPIIAADVSSMHMTMEPIVSLFIYTVLIATITPAASPFAAILHGNKQWLSSNIIYKYTPILTLAVLVICIIFGVTIVDIFFVF